MDGRSGRAGGRTARRVGGSGSVLAAPSALVAVCFITDLPRAGERPTSAEAGLRPRTTAGRSKTSRSSRLTATRASAVVVTARRLPRSCAPRAGDSSPSACSFLFFTFFTCSSSSWSSDDEEAAGGPPPDAPCSLLPTGIDRQEVVRFGGISELVVRLGLASMRRKESARPAAGGGRARPATAMHARLHARRRPRRRRAAATAN
jgi:hypothetical protein